MIRRMSMVSYFVVAALFLVLAGSAVQSEARVNVSVGINLPAVRFEGPPDVVVIPGTYVYMVPGIDVDVLFFQGYWWRPYEGQWYRSRDYKGQWRHVEPRSIPRGLRALPQDYRQRISSGHERIPHGDVSKNWRKWEKQKHWDRKDEQSRGRHGDQNRDGRDEHKGRY